MNKTRKMIMFDNECTFMYKTKCGVFFTGLQRRSLIFKKVLNLFCIFRRTTIEMVKRLSKMSDPANYVLAYAKKQEPLLHIVEEGMFQEYRDDFETEFKDRLVLVLERIEECKRINKRSLI